MSESFESCTEVLTPSIEEFAGRERERSVVRPDLEAVVARIMEAESRLSTYCVFGSEARLAPGRARVEVLLALRAIDKAAEEENPTIRTASKA